MRPRLFGRENELQTIERLLDDARQRRGRSLLLHGDPGVGKTTLLGAAADATSGMRILRCSGVQSEASLAFAALQQLITPVVDRLDRLPDLQARAVRSAIGLGEAGGDRFLIGVGLLTLIADLAEDQPVLMLVDDAQWLDEPSADALLFVARRLEAESAAAILAAQDGVGADLRGRGLVELLVRGLDRDPARQLLADRLPDLAVGVTDRLIETTGGNPLGLIELGSALTPDQRRGLTDVPEGLPVGARIHQALIARIQQLPQDSRRCALVVALEHLGDVRSIRAAIAEMAIDLSALDVPETKGLIVTDGNGITFAHPLIRSAVISTSTLAERIATHEALANVLRDDVATDRRLWHLAAISGEADDELAGALEAAADRAQLRSGSAAAASMLERAARLSSDAAERGRRLVAAAGRTLDAGKADRIEPLLREAESLPIDDATRAEAGTLRAVVQFDHQSLATASHTLIDSSALVARSNPGMAARIRLTATRMAWFGDDLDNVRTLADGVVDLDLPADDPHRAIATALSSRQLDPTSRAARYDAAHAALDRSIGVVPLHSFLPSFIAELFGEDDRALEYHVRFVAAARAQGAVTQLAWGLVALAWLQHTVGDFAGGLIGATEATSLGNDTSQPTIAARSAAILALIAAGQGRIEECRRFAAEAGSVAEARGLRTTASVATWALGRLHLGIGDHAAAFERLRQLADGRVWPGRRLVALFATADAIEAAVRIGQLQEAADWLRGFETWWQHGPPAWARVVILRSRALLAEGPEAIAHASGALAVEGASRRVFEHARTELLVGSLLRRERQRKASREHLRRAVETFERIGAGPWIERANAELRATGESIRPAAHPVVAEVTPQELQIARLAAQGMTNRQIGEQLFLSPRTVGSHLYRLFPKLGISARAELRTLDLAAMEPPGRQRGVRRPRRRDLGSGGLLRIGVFPFMADSHAVRRLVAAFLDAHPGRRMRVLERWTPQQEQLLDGDELDVGIVTWPIAGGPYESAVLVRQRAEVAINRSDPLAAQPEVGAEDLATRTWMFPSASTHVALHNTVRDWFDTRNLEPRMADLQGWVPSSLSSLQAALRGERSWTILLPAFAGALDADIVRRPIRDGPVLQVVMIAPAGGRSQDVADFLAIGRGIARDFIDPALTDVALAAPGRG